MTKNVFIIKCDKKIFQKNFRKKKNSEVINKHEIINKIPSKDLSNSYIPEIVKYQIIKKINSFKESKKINFLYLLSEDINVDSIDEFKKIFKNCQYLTYYHLITDEILHLYDKDLREKLNSIELIEDDKNQFI